MGYGIVIGNQKGGVSKTTTTGLLGFILSEHYRVLMVDCDMQSNLTKMLTGKDSETFKDKSILEAIKEENAEPYIVKNIIPGRTLDLLPATEYLALFKAMHPSDYNKLNIALNSVRIAYDFILFDTPPALGDHLISACLAADGVINLTMTHEYAVDGSIRFINRLREIRQYKPSLKLLGVAVAIFENTSTNRKMADQLRNLYKEMIFNTYLFKRAAVSRLKGKKLHNLKPKDFEALENHIQLAKEVLVRVRQYQQ